MGDQNGDGGTAAAAAESVPDVEQEIVAVETDPTGRYTRVRIFSFPSGQPLCKADLSHRNACCCSFVEISATG